MNHPIKEFETFETTYPCTIYEISPSPVYGEFQSDYRIEFIYEADAGDISRLLCLNSRPFVHYESNVVMDKKTFNCLMEEVGQLYGRG